MINKTTTELLHILKHKKHFPVATVNRVHREYSKRMRNRRLKEELKKTFEKFGQFKN